MEAAQALADLAEISSQVEAAILADEGGSVVASTFEDAESAERFAKAAADLLAAAEEQRAEGGEQRVQIQAATPEGSVFVVRDDRHLVAAVTGADPTVGLLFYDLKTCLRLAGEEPAKKPARRRRKPKEEAEESDGEE